MKIKKLSKEERKDIYNKHLSNDFHESEVKPLKLIESLVEKENYSIYGFYKDEKLVGYVCFIKIKGIDILLIDYLAIVKDSRSQGFGSEMIAVMKKEFLCDCKGIIAEVENPRFSLDEEDKINRERRISFYLRNEFKLSQVETRVSTDQYTIIKLELNRKIDDEEIYNTMAKIYVNTFGEDIFNKHIDLSLN